MAQQTADIKFLISGIIDGIWGKGIIANNTPENINDDVINVVNDVVERIKTCSKKMVRVDMTYNLLYSAPGTIWEVLAGLVADMVANGIKDPNNNVLATYIGWFDALRGNRQYRTCIVSAALYNRSRLEMAFLGI